MNIGKLFRQLYLPILIVFGLGFSPVPGFAKSDKFEQEVVAIEKRAAELTSLGQYGEASNLYHKALAMILQDRGEWHADAALRYAQMGNANDRVQQFRNGEPFHRRALKIWLRDLGAQSHLVAAGYDNLALNLYYQRKNDEAGENARKGMAIWEKIRGKNHPDTATSYNNLALILDAQGDLTGSEALMRQALAINIKLLGKGHPQAIMMQENLAGNLAAQKKFDEALKIMDFTLAMRISGMPKGHPDLPLAYDKLGNMYADASRHEEALGTFRSSLARWIKIVGEKHAQVGQTRYFLARQLVALDRSKEASIEIAKAVGIVTAKLGPTHALTVKFKQLQKQISEGR